jgi:membrane-associated phospholipid phosphatase
MGYYINMEKSLLLVLALTIWFAYLPLNNRKSLYYFKTKFDSRIPLIPITVWLYIAFFPYIFSTTIILWNSPLFNQYMVSSIIAGLFGIIIWYLFPNGVIRPKIPIIKSLSQKILTKIYHHDHDTNGFPSSHVYNTLITTYFLTLQYQNLKYPLWLLATAITISTVTTKQHYIVDILGGILVTILAILISSNIAYNL